MSYVCLMEKYQSIKVFTPTSPAIDTFVERNNRINNHLVDALITPGKQIVLYGHSGCGKTTLLTNKLNETYESTITTRCMDSMTFESIILDGFSQLGGFYTETVKTKGFKIAPSIMVSYNEIRGTLNLGEISNLKQTTTKAILSPQLTPQKLAKFFGESKSCWVLEDFHKIKGVEKSRTSQLMKVFMDMSVDYPQLKLIALGAVGTARQVIEYDNEMNNRVAEIFIPYMDATEIYSIITQGEKLLNLRFSKDVKSRIVKYSCGLPSICHQLCLNICFANRIYETAKQMTSINVTELDAAIEKYIDEKSDTLKAEFDKAIKIQNNVLINIPKEILKACLRINKDEFSFDDIFNVIKPQQRIRKDDFEKFLSELCLPKRSEMLIYDDNSNTYRFNNLFLKGYALLQFKTNKEEGSIHTYRDAQMVKRLLEIIERNISADDSDYFLEGL